MIRRPPRSTLSSSSAASDVYKRQNEAGRAVRPSPGSCTPRWSVHSSANQLRTNDDAPIRDGELPPWFRSLASAQVSYIRCFSARTTATGSPSKTGWTSPAPAGDSAVPRPSSGRAPGREAPPEEPHPYLTVSTAYGTKERAADSHGSSPRCALVRVDQLISC